MAQDAEIKLVLDTKEAIQEAKAFGPRLEKMLNVRVNNQGFVKLQNYLKDTLTTAGLLSEKTTEAGEAVLTLAKGFRTEGLKDYENKLTDIFKTVDAITENEKNLAEVQKQIAVLEGNEKGKSVKSLQGIYAGTKDQDKKAAAKITWENAKKQLEDAKAKESELLAQQKELNNTFDAQYKKVTYVCNAMEKVSDTSTKLKANVEVMEEVYTDLNKQAADTANNEQTAADKAKELGVHTKDVADNAEDADAAINKVTEGLGNATDAADKLKDKVAEASSATSDSATSATKGTSTEDHTNEIKELIQEIYNLKVTGRDASEQVTQLGRVLSTELGNKDRFDLTQLFLDTDEAIKYVKKDLEMSDLLRDEFNSVGDFFEQVRKKLNELNAEARKAGEPVVDAAQEIEQNVQKINDTVVKIPTMKFDNDFDARKNIDELKAAMKSIVDMGMPIQLKDQYNLLKKAIDDSKEAQKQFNNTVEEPTAEQKLTELQNTVQGVIATTSRIDEAMKTDAATENIAELIRRLNELNAAKKTLETLNLPKDADPTYNRIIQLIAILTGQISDYKKQLNGVSEKHEKTKKSGTDFAKAVSANLKSLKSTMSSLDKASNKVKSSFDRMAHSMRSNFKHMITNITKYVLGFRSLFFLVRRLRKYIGEGIQNLAKFNDGNNIVNESITDMLSSLLFLKNAWAAAFSPIITFVRPILVKLIDSLAEVGNAIARFMSALLGQEIAFNAVRVKAQDYADTLDNAGGSASGAADKVKKLTDRLAAFDDLNVLGVDNDPDGTGSGGGGGLADEYMPDPNEMFKIVDPERNGFLEMLKKAWEDADFSVVGATIKDKIIAQLQGIDWDSVQGTGTKIGSSLGSFIAGLFGDPELFKAAGTTIGETLNTITYTVQAFLDWTDEIDFGGNLAEGFNTFLDVTDWQTAGDNINRVITGIVDNVDSFITTLDADKVVTAIKDFMTGLKIKEIVASVIDLALDVTNLVLTVTGGLVWEWGQSFGDFLINWVKEDMPSAYTDENGIKVPISIDMTPTFDYDEHPLAALLERIQTGLGKAILNKVLNVEDLSPDELADLTDSWNRIIDKLFKAVVDTFTLGTGTGGIITSLLNPPKDEEGNTDWEQIGYDIADGIWIGMGKSLKKIGDNQWIRENIYDPFWEAVSNIFDMHSPSKVTEEWGGWIGEGLLNGISNLIPDVEQIFIDLKDWLSGKWDEIKGNTYEKWVGIKTNVLTKADEIKDSAEEKFDTLKTNLTNKWQEIKGAIYEKLVGIKLNMKEVFEQMGEAIKAPINTIIDIIEGMVNKCIDGINSLTSGLGALTDLGSEIANKIGMPSIPHIGQLSHITIPHLAQGAVIPPNREFMAVLGDQSHGTNIEAPLDTIKQAVAEVLANNGNAEMIQLLQQLITVVENKNLVIGDKDIGKANARYVKQQNIVRGSTF